MKKILLLILLLTLAASCGEKYLAVEPKAQITVDNFYKTEDDAFRAVLAAYSVLQGPRFYG
ncbi:MAG: hypothetical protein NW207_10335, partial [Cytophagales bacterium]|nr:hypothetical protein [Cytophagales bacterium]